jgi:hypothetical protein
LPSCSKQNQAVSPKNTGLIGHAQLYYDCLACMQFVTRVARYGARVLLWASLELLVVVPSGSASAQVGDTPTIKPHTGHSYKRVSVDDHLRRLTRNLDLDETQQSAVRKILVERQQQTLRIRQDETLSGNARIQEFRALQDDTVLRIRALLNEDQKKKYDPLASRRIQPAPDRRTVEDWLKVVTPQQTAPPQ